MKSVIATVLVSFLFGFIKCSMMLSDKQVSLTESSVRYEGRFSRIEPFSGFEIIDAAESMTQCKNLFKMILFLSSPLDNVSFFEPSTTTGCDIICKLKAASVPVIVPSDEAAEGRIPIFDKYWLKIKLLRDLSELPAETFTQNRNVFEITMKMIGYHLFYRIQEYSRYIQDIMEKYPSIEDVHKHVERAWALILKPVHIILNKIIRLNSKQIQIEDSFIAEIVQLISSPIEEESQMTSSLISFILFDSDSSITRAVLSAIKDLVKKTVSGEIPFISIEPVLRFVGDLMMPCSQRPESLVTSRMAEIVKTKILQLNGHLRFFWIQEAYTHCMLQYFIFFEIGEGMSIKRTPFEPIFPDVSPFNNSEEVNMVRKALIRRSDDENSHISRLNQLAKFDSMFKFMLYQFYPRSMLVDIFESITIEFVDHLSIEAAFLFYALITKTEIFGVEDEVSSYVKRVLDTITEDIGACQRHGNELGRICGSLAQQIELIK